MASTVSSPALRQTLIDAFEARPQPSTQKASVPDRLNQACVLHERRAIAKWLHGLSSEATTDEMYANMLEECESNVQAFYSQLHSTAQEEAGNVEQRTQAHHTYSHVPESMPDQGVANPTSTVAQVSNNSDAAQNRMETIVLRNMVVVKHETQDEFGNFDSIIGGEDAKDKLMSQFVLAHLYPNMMDVFQQKGLLLYGPPGTGKTAMVRALVAELFRCRQQARDISTTTYFIPIHASDFKSRWIGGTEQNIKAFFTIARDIVGKGTSNDQREVIVVLDEVESLVMQRQNDAGHNPSFATLATILTEMTSLDVGANDNIAVIATTNDPASVDRAFLRRLPFQVLQDIPETVLHYMQVFAMQIDRYALSDSVLRGVVEQNVMKGGTFWKAGLQDKPAHPHGNDAVKMASRLWCAGLYVPRHFDDESSESTILARELSRATVPGQIWFNGLFSALLPPDNASQESPLAALSTHENALEVLRIISDWYENITAKEDIRDTWVEHRQSDFMRLLGAHKYLQYSGFSASHIQERARSFISSIASAVDDDQMAFYVPVMLEGNMMGHHANKGRSKSATQQFRASPFFYSAGVFHHEIDGKSSYQLNCVPLLFAPPFSSESRYWKTMFHHDIEQLCYAMIKHYLNGRRVQMIHHAIQEKRGIQHGRSGYLQLQQQMSELQQFSFALPAPQIDPTDQLLQIVPGLHLQQGQVLPPFSVFFKALHASDMNPTQETGKAWDIQEDEEFKRLWTEIMQDNVVSATIGRLIKTKTRHFISTTAIPVLLPNLPSSKHVHVQDIQVGVMLRSLLENQNSSDEAASAQALLSKFESSTKVETYILEKRVNGMPNAASMPLIVAYTDNDDPDSENPGVFHDFTVECICASAAPQANRSNYIVTFTYHKFQIAHGKTQTPVRSFSWTPTDPNIGRLSFLPATTPMSSSQRLFLKSSFFDAQAAANALIPSDRLNELEWEQMKKRIRQNGILRNFNVNRPTEQQLLERAI